MISFVTQNFDISENSSSLAYSRSQMIPTAYRKVVDFQQSFMTELFNLNNLRNCFFFEIVLD